MPEGHTLHALAGRLDTAFAGTEVHVASPQGRFAESAAMLDRLVLEGAEAVGKHLLLRFADEQLVHVHLGLFGKFRVTRHRRAITADDQPPEDLPVTGQVRMRLVNLTHVADLRGPTACELLSPDEWAERQSRIGVDPLRTRTLPASTLARMTRSRRPVGQVLMDQSLVSGVGNVYRAEILHRHRLDPWQPTAEVPHDLLRRIWRDLVRLMPLGVETGRILVSDADVRRARRALREGRSGRIRPSYAVYRRAGQACPRCDGIVARATLAGRNLFWCPGCQVRQPGTEPEVRTRRSPRSG